MNRLTGGAFEFSGIGGPIETVATGEVSECGRASGNLGTGGAW